jgi:enoyl-CoA hydratase/carnithine racemase
MDRVRLPRTSVTRSRDGAYGHPMTDRVQITISDGIADVRLNRPDKLNALDVAMFSALVDAGEQLKSDPSVRAVVLSGSGRGFCAGLDFSGFQSMVGEGDGGGSGASAIGAVPEGRITHNGQQACWTWRELPVPVIAAVHGVAFGGGLQVALGADIRLVAPDVRMSVLEIRWGITPDMIATQVLPKLVGPDVAKELAWTGREVAGDEAVRIGLATRVCTDPHAEAMALAAEIASKNPDAIRGAKHLIDLSHHASWAEGFAEERRMIGSIIGTPNQAEAVGAFFEKREPVFRDVEA